MMMLWGLVSCWSVMASSILYLKMDSPFSSAEDKAAPVNESAAIWLWPRRVVQGLVCPDTRRRTANMGWAIIAVAFFIFQGHFNQF